MSTNVNYKIFNGKKLLRERTYAACYSDITYGTLEKNATDIVLYHDMNDVKYTKEVCAEWVKHVKSWGFHCSFIGTSSEKYGIAKNNIVIRIPIKRPRKVYYTKKLHLTSALMMCRYLFEDRLDALPEHFFRLLKEEPKANTFYLMQIAHFFIGGNSNHSVRDFTVRKLVTLEKMQDKMKKCKYSIYNTSYPGITASWIMPEKRIDKNMPVKQLINLLKEEKMIVYIVGHQKNYADWLEKVILTDKMEEADLVIFTGGEDVDPELYGENRHPYTQYNRERDNYEKGIFLEAQKQGKRMLGICRGSQFLCVMSGGKLVQHQKNPSPVHEITVRKGYGPKQKIKITSTHHQAQYPFNMERYKYDVLGYTEGMLPFHEDGEQKELNPPLECEIVHYRYTKALGIQGHPEFEHYYKDPENAEAIKLLRGMVDDLVHDNL